VLGARRQERGQVVLVLLVGVLIATLFMVGGFEVTRLVQRALVGQNTCDGAARAAATWQARGLNVIGSANVASSLLLLEYVLPFPEMDAFDPALEEAAREIAALQDSVALLYPAMGVVAASAVARQAGMDALSAEDLREMGYEEAAEWLASIESSGELGAVLSGALHAVPVGSDQAQPMLSLGVHRAEREGLAHLAAAFLASDGTALDMIFGQFDAPIYASAQAPVLLFGHHGPADYSLVESPGAAEDVMQLIYLVAPGVHGTENVLTHRGVAKLERFLGYPPRTTPIGLEDLLVVRALGPVDADELAARFGWTKTALVERSIELAIEALQSTPDFAFSFYVFDRDPWTRSGASTTMLARERGWSSALVPGEMIDAVFLAAAAPVAHEPTVGAMVLPIFDDVGLRQVADDDGDGR